MRIRTWRERQAGLGGPTFFKLKKRPLLTFAANLPRPAGITDDFRRGYATVWACGRRADQLATSVLQAVEPLVPGPRLLAAIDETPTPRWGP